VDLRAALITALLAAAAGAAAQPAAASTAAAAAPQPLAPEALVDLGRRTYTGSCARCHGINLASNGLGFDLRTFPAGDRERFDRALKNGLRAMPALGGALTQQQQDAIWAYIGSVNGWAPK
jgi:cytochrome c55X